MPQLDPAPWFMIFMYSWLIFIILPLLKMPNYINLVDPNLKTYKGLNKSWFWPWP